MNGNRNVNCDEHRPIEPLISARFAGQVYANAEVSLPARITLSGSAWELLAAEAGRTGETLDGVASRYLDAGISAYTKRHLATQDAAN